MDRYLENARRAMASAIVDAGDPKMHQTVRTFDAGGMPEQGLGSDEIGVYGNRRSTSSDGANLTSWPGNRQCRQY